MALAVVLAFRSVIPTGNLLFSKLCPVHRGRIADERAVQSRDLTSMSTSPPPRKKFRQQSQQKNSHQDRHIHNQDSAVASHCVPGPFQPGNNRLFYSLFPTP